MTVDQLNEQFSLPGILHFDGHPTQPAFARAQVTLPSCTATIYLHGAHLTHWQPTGQAPVIFLSDRSEFAPGRPIRGGIPLCFPWFGPDQQGRAAAGRPGPSHGFARLQDWDLTFAALLPGEPGDADPSLHLTFTLAPTDLSRSLGFDHFRVACEVILGQHQGKKLTLRLSVANLSTEPLPFEEALHTYFAVGDIRQTTIEGLESAVYLDKTDSMKEQKTPAEPLQLTGWTDRVFPGNVASVTLHDRTNLRTITIDKSNSATTVLWNPWTEASTTLADLPPDAWPGFVCVEAANTATETITLPPREAHTLQLEVTCSSA